MSKLFLDIGDGLRLPATEAVTQTLVVYGGKGMGKTNFGAVLCEELAAAGKRFCFIDPVGVAWGLRHSASGKGEGLKILILGGRHGDVPIEPTGGAVVADFIADSTDSVLIDISSRTDGRRWTIPDKIRFVGDYITRLLERQGEHRRPIMQIIDEAARFAPQMVMKGSDVTITCLNAIEVLVEEGRNAGVGITLLTQRSARMAKSVSELAEAMISFRIIGPNSVDAVLDWFGEHVHKSKWNELVEQLRKLPRGTALVVSPGWLEVEGTARIRLRTTFDSSKTPTGTERRLAQQVKPADLDKLRTLMADTVQKAEAADPTTLRAKLTAVTKRAGEMEAKLAALTAKLEAERAKPKTSASAEDRQQKIAEVRADLVRYRRALEAAMKILVKVRAVDFPVESEDDRKTLEQAVAAAVRQVTGPIEKRVTALAAKVEGIKSAAGDAETAITALLNDPLTLSVEVTKQAPYAVTPKPASSAARRPAPAPKAPTGPLAEDDRLVSAKGGFKKHIVGILTALAQHGDRPRDQVLILAGYSPSGDISTGFAALLAHGLIEAGVGATVRISEAGRAALGPVDPLPTGDELRTYTLARASTSAERRILGALFEAYPAAEPRADLHARAGIRPSGDTSVAFAKLLRLGWAVERDGGIAASELFFTES